MFGGGGGGGGRRRHGHRGDGRGGRRGGKGTGTVVVEEFVGGLGARAIFFCVFFSFGEATEPRGALFSVVHGVVVVCCVCCVCWVTLVGKDKNKLI